MEQQKTSVVEKEKNYLLEKRNLHFLLLLLVVLIFLPFFSREDKSSAEILQWNTDNVTLLFPDNSGFTIYYQDITSVSFVEDPVLGSCISGSSEGALRYGIWENKTLGQYILYSHQSFSPIIQICTSEQVFHISVESPETTAALYESLLEIIQTYDKHA